MQSLGLAALNEGVATALAWSLFLRNSQYMAESAGCGSRAGVKERLEANQQRFRSQLKTQRAKHIEEYFESGGAFAEPAPMATCVACCLGFVCRALALSCKDHEQPHAADAP